MGKTCFAEGIISRTYRLRRGGAVRKRPQRSPQQQRGDNYDVRTEGEAKKGIPKNLNFAAFQYTKTQKNGGGGRSAFLRTS